MSTLSESEFDALFSKFYCLSYMIKYNRLYQFYKPLLRHYESSKLLSLLNYELYRLLFIATWDIHKRELHQKLYRFGIYRNYWHLKKIKCRNSVAIINNLYNKTQLINRQHDFIAIDCNNGKFITKATSMRIIL